MAKTHMIQFDQSQYKGLSNFSANVILQNCYPVADKGRSTFTLTPIPGSVALQELDNIVGTGCRGMYRSSTGSVEDAYIGTVYAVYGNSVIRYSPRKTITVIGTINSGNTSSICTFAENQAQTDTDTYVYVCDGQTIYKFNGKATDAAIASTWEELGNLPHRPDSATAYVTPAYISWIDYRLIMCGKDTNAWFFTDTGTDTFKETNVYFGESRNDRTVRVTEFGGNVWSFGTFSYDIFSRTGNRLKPYSSPKSATGKIGLASGDSLSIIDDYMFWLGSGDTSTNGIYMATKTGGITRISDDGIEEIIRHWKYQGYARGFSYSDKGNLFYFITSEADNMTLGYNASTKKWFSCGTGDNGQISYWDVSHVCYGYDNEIYFGSRTSNAICKFDRDICIDYMGRPITRLWQSPVYIDNLKNFKIVKLVIDVESGISTSYIEPCKLFIQLSWTGGTSWPTERIDKELGVKGKYGQTVAIHGGGVGKNLCIRVGTSDHVPIKMYQIRMDIEELAR